MKPFAKEGDPLYLDNHLLVFDKPACIATQPDFHEMARAWVKKAFSKEGAVFIEPVHRLDKAASGLVLFAKTSKALSRLNEALREREVIKHYIAQIEGILYAKQGVLTHFLLHGDHRAIVDPQRGKQSLLSYKVLHEHQARTTVAIVLETGRYHQIRAQFAAIGHPIVADRKYGSRISDPRLEPGAIALQHQQLVFAHPVTKEKIVVESLRTPFFLKEIKSKQ